MSIEVKNRMRTIYLDFKTAFFHALTITLRRDRFILMAIISVLPVMIPVFVALFSKTLFRENGLEIFVKLCEQVYIHTVVPLLALFLGLIGIREEVDSLTIIYLLIRPVSKFAWVLGRFIAYLLVATFLIVMGIFFTFTACVILGSIHFDTTGLGLMIQYMGVGFAGLVAYGAISFALGTGMNHPIIAGVILFFGWEKLANYVPGIADFWTVQKYLDSMFPVLATQRYNRAVVSVLGSFQKELYFVSTQRAIATIAIVMALFLILSVFFMRSREYTKDRVVGSK